jgi:hypothetical protein
MVSTEPHPAGLAPAGQLAASLVALLTISWHHPQ